MILRRVIEHVKAQNWTAVALDFVIVVVGVFIGLQVSNWNDDRRAAVEERRLIVQLQGEVSSAIERKENWLEQTQPPLNNQKSAIEIIQSPEENAILSDSDCRAIALSHVISFQTSALPTLEEILSTGGLGTLANPQVRSALMRYKSGLNEVQALYEFIRQDFANLIDNYGDYFPRKYVEGAPVDDFPIASDVECRLDRLSEDQSLKNKLVSNLARTQELFNQAHVELALLTEIESALKGVAQ